jgi:hypothetical protein
MNYRFALAGIAILFPGWAAFSQDVPAREIELYRNAVAKQQKLICKMAHPLGTVKSFQPLQPEANQAASEFRYKMSWLGVTNKEYETVLSFNVSGDGAASKYSVTVSADDNSPSRSFEAANVFAVVFRRKLEKKLDVLLSAKVKMAEGLVAQLEHCDGAKLLGIWLDLAPHHPEIMDHDEK